MFIVITKRRASLATSPLGWLKSAKKNGEGEKTLGRRGKAPNAVIPTIRAQVHCCNSSMRKRQILIC